MSKPISRRDALKGLGSAGASAFLASHLPNPRPLLLPQGTPTPQLRIGNTPVELSIAPVSSQTVRITALRLTGDGRTEPLPNDGSLTQPTWDPPVRRLTTLERETHIASGELALRLTPDPLTIEIRDRQRRLVQRLRIDQDTGALTFPLGDSPVLGLGEGGPQFDRRGDVDRMRSGQGGYRLRTHGGRVPIPWLIGTSGWALFFHSPFGTFDLSGSEGRFAPASPEAATPLDLFVVAAREPAALMAEYALLTGFPELPPLWALGYQQSHRTITSREEIVGIARTFREKQLPCDALIYLGTGFAPSGWNTANGSFAFNPRVFPDPEAVIQELHALHFRVVLHAVILTDRLRGTVHDPCDLQRFDEEEASCYWNAHRKDFGLGVDGWWPDEGDPLDISSRLTRIRMYWEGPQLDRPNERPYALHRNGYAGMQRYAPFLWSGDVYSTWETLRTHIPVAINTALSGIPYWGTDTGGFVPTKEFTGELYVRWFQFSAFCPLFRSHGRTWKLRLPWGWNTGELGANEISGYNGSVNPDPSELHNAAVEPICKRYLELRYRMLPYLYSTVHEAHETGLPIIRALWLHYPDDPAAVARGDEYLWGRDVLVAPVTEPGATSRRLYLPRGRWYDFWTEEATTGGREVDRPVDLATLPLYVRAGAILPLGPVKQYTAEPVDAPLSVTIYPGADGDFLLYEDDGITFDYRKGAWMGVRMTWDDRRRTLALRLTDGSRMLPPRERRIDVRVAPEKTARAIVFDGRAMEVTL
jgi:alpha-glucosidase (family GH31 glycosyl hydrolase)